MTVNLAGGCRVSEMREGEPLIHGTLRLWRRISRASGAQAISLRVMEFAPGLSPGIRNDDCDEILYLIDPHEEFGASRNDVSTAKGGRSVDLWIDGCLHQVHPNTGIYIRPRQSFALK